MILGKTWQMLPSTPVAPLKVSRGYCCCSGGYCRVWNQLCLPSGPLIFPGLCVSYGTLDFSKRTRVLILTPVLGAAPDCLPLPSLQLRASPMLVQTPHLFSYFQAKLGFQGRAVSRSSLGSGLSCIYQGREHSWLCCLHGKAVAWSQGLQACSAALSLPG